MTTFSNPLHHVSRNFPRSAGTAGLVFGSICALAFATACGRPQDARNPEDAEATEHSAVLAGRTPEEKAVLGKVESLASGVPTKVGSTTVTAEEGYTAASGQYCRRLLLHTEGESTSRLACRQEEGWFFAAEVMQPSAPPQTAPSSQTDPSRTPSDQEPAP